MSKWIPVFKDKAKKLESWACKGCGALDRDHDHAHGPENGTCSCDKRLVMAGSEAYRANYDLIRWGNA